MVFLVLLGSLQGTSPLAVVDDLIRDQQDILHYDIAIAIPDAGRAISGATSIRFVVRGGRGPLVLDFDRALAIDSIVADSALMSGDQWRWTAHTSGAGLAIDHWGRVGDTLTVHVYYHGRPSDGLIIQRNVHGDRTAFADNWPARARHWFPSEDHPSDKATVSYAVEVPNRWRVVANGRLLGSDQVGSGRSVWRWLEERPIPVHTMVFGAGRMSVTELGDVHGIPQSVWTFPQDSAFAVDQPFRRAKQMVEVFSDLLGPFPYQKLAHVQSSTRFGGMENSSAIFYNERGYASRTMTEGVVAHEIAHQWFGDAVAQYDWHHLWLSEGFATYLQAVFYELIGEEEVFRSAMRRHKRRYSGSAVVGRSVIDTTVGDPMGLLNTNSYSKGAWVLHMLRGEIGDSLFFECLREYYRIYRDSTALTSEFAAVVARRVGRPMDWFFQQWLLEPGYPKLDVQWNYDRRGRTVSVLVRQTQPPDWADFVLSIPLTIVARDSSVTHHVIRVSGRETRVDGLPQRAEPSRLEVDPDAWLLLEVVRVARRG